MNAIVRSLRTRNWNTTTNDAAGDASAIAEISAPAMTIDGLVGLFGPPGMPLALRQRITADIRAVADKTIEDRLTITGQLMNIGGPEEFAASIEQQRSTVAQSAKELGIAELPQN